MTQPLPLSKELFSRQQIGALAGIDASTLNYWSRERLLVPTEGGGGKGSHRRFNFIQVHIAAILGEIRRFGLNVAALKSLANTLQQAVRLGESYRLHPGKYGTAAFLATELSRFRSGEAVMVTPNFNATPPAGLSGRALHDWAFAKRPAVSEAEIIEKIVTDRSDYEPDSRLLEAAALFGPNNGVHANLYTDLVTDVLAPGYSGTYSWLLVMGPDNSWRISFGSITQMFDGMDEDEIATGIFIPVSKVIRRIWPLDVDFD